MYPSFIHKKTILENYIICTRVNALKLQIFLSDLCIKMNKKPNLVCGRIMIFPAISSIQVMMHCKSHDARKK